MTIKKVTLKNIKRSYRRLIDKVWDSDMGYWFCDRAEDMAYMRGVTCVWDVIEAVKLLFDEIKDLDEDEDDIRASRMVAGWLERWTKACGIEDIQYYLACLKDEVIDTPEPDIDDPEHIGWLESTWDQFDDMKAADVIDADACPFPLVADFVREGKTIGDIYDRLSELEELA